MRSVAYAVASILAIAAAPLALASCQSEPQVELAANQDAPTESTKPVKTAVTVPVPSADPTARDHRPDPRAEQRRLEAALNPNGIPVDRLCVTVDMPDPVAAAQERISQGDRRPFKVGGFVHRPDIPGMVCTSESIQGAIPPRGGSFVSDIPDVCGGKRSFHNVPPASAALYNQTLAADPVFQRITQCRPTDVCEQIERTFNPKSGFQPQCAASHVILGRLASFGETNQFERALKAYPKETREQRDGLTQALNQAISLGRMDRAKALVAAGADVHGKLSTGERTMNPLYQVFNQNSNKPDKISMATWLISKGADFTNPNGDVLGITEPEHTRFMIEHGAPVNGHPGDAEQRELPLDLAMRQVGFGRPMLGEKSFADAQKNVELIRAAGGRSANGGR